jgi:hypothetical protein
VRLHRQWKEQRIHGDQAAFAALEAWMKQDRANHRRRNG